MMMYNDAELSATERRWPSRRRVAMAAAKPAVLDRITRVVLVGNAPYDAARPLGELIDAYDVVIRFNNFAIAGHERYVGSKTTIWCFIHNSAGVIDPQVNPYDAVWVARPAPVATPMPAIRDGCPVTVLGSSHYRRARQAARYPLRPPRSTSTGFVAICYALTLYRRVAICGFNFFLPSQALHYYDDGKPQHVTHYGRLEQGYIRRLQRQGRVVAVSRLAAAGGDPPASGLIPVPVEPD